MHEKLQLRLLFAVAFKLLALFQVKLHLFFDFLYLKFKQISNRVTLIQSNSYHENKQVHLLKQNSLSACCYGRLPGTKSLQLIYYLTQTQVTKLLLLVHRDLTPPSGPMKPILLGVLFSNDTDITIVRLAPDHQCFQIFQIRNL